jgi:hypothetical protein
MFESSRGTLVPAGKWLLAVLLAVNTATPIAAWAADGSVNVRTLPRLEGAVEDPVRTESWRMTYKVPGTLADTIAAIRKLLAADGWTPYAMPLEDSPRIGVFKKGAQGLRLFYMTDGNRTDRSAIDFSNDQLGVDLPFPEGATDIVYDARRPYLNCLSPATVDASLDFFGKQLVGSGWSRLSAADIAAHWPNADITDKVENGVRAYYGRDTKGSGPKQLPVMLSLQHRADGRTGVEINVASFALPQNLELASEEIGLPVPKYTPGFGSTGSTDSTRRKIEGTTIAEIPAVLAFYRRELAARGWKEETNGAITVGNEVALNFASADQTATLKLSHKYDLTVVNLVTQVTQAGLAARAKAKKDSDDKFMSDASAMVKSVTAADEVRRAAQAGNLSDAPLHARTDQTTPVPLPENAENVQFNGADGKLGFDSASTVSALAAFYRGVLKPQGWKEQPSVINKSNMVVMEFSRGGKELSFTAMQMGPKVNVSADGSGLVMANAGPAENSTAAKTPANAKTPVAPAAVAQNLEAEPDSALPVPKEHSMSSIGTGKLPGTDTAIRRELNASVPAELGSVLTFYRGELGKRGWKESAERAVVQPDQVQLAFASPDGPATLKLGRSGGETTVNLAQKIPAAAAKGDLVPKPGQARLMFVNVGDSEAALTINKQTIRIAAGAGGPHAKGPSLDLPPGKYQYSLKVAGHPAQTDAIEVAADDTWGLMVAPDGAVMPLHVY